MFEGHKMLCDHLESKLYTVFDISQKCLIKNIASEASYVYIYRRQKLIKNAKMTLSNETF